MFQEKLEHLPITTFLFSVLHQRMSFLFQRMRAPRCRVAAVLSFTHTTFTYALFMASRLEKWWTLCVHLFPFVLDYVVYICETNCTILKIKAFETYLENFHGVRDKRRMSYRAGADMGEATVLVHSVPVSECGRMPRPSAGCTARSDQGPGAPTTERGAIPAREVSVLRRFRHGLFIM